MHTLLLHWYKHLKKCRLCSGRKKGHAYLGMRWRQEDLERGIMVDHKALWGMMEIFISWIVVIVSWLYTYVKFYPLNTVCFMLITAQQSYLKNSAAWLRPALPSVKGRLVQVRKVLKAPQQRLSPWCTKGDWQRVEKGMTLPFCKSVLLNTLTMRHFKPSPIPPGGTQSHPTLWETLNQEKPCKSVTRQLYLINFELILEIYSLA